MLSARKSRVSSSIKTVMPVLMLLPMLQSCDTWRTNGFVHTEDNMLGQWRVTSWRSWLSSSSCGSEWSPADFPSPYSKLCPCLLLPTPLRSGISRSEGIQEIWGPWWLWLMLCVQKSFQYLALPLSCPLLGAPSHPYLLSVRWILKWRNGHS